MLSFSVRIQTWQFILSNVKKSTDSLITFICRMTSPEFFCLKVSLWPTCYICNNEIKDFSKFLIGPQPQANMDFFNKLWSTYILKVSRMWTIKEKIAFSKSCWVSVCIKHSTVRVSTKSHWGCFFSFFFSFLFDIPHFPTLTYIIKMKTFLP